MTNEDKKWLCELAVELYRALASTITPEMAAIDSYKRRERIAKWIDHLRDYHIEVRQA